MRGIAISAIVVGAALSGWLRLPLRRCLPDGIIWAQQFARRAMTTIAEPATRAAMAMADVVTASVSCIANGATGTATGAAGTKA